LRFAPEKLNSMSLPKLWEFNKKLTQLGEELQKFVKAQKELRTWNQVVNQAVNSSQETRNKFKSLLQKLPNI